MKLRHLVNGTENEGKVIAQFGRAMLIQQREGKWRLEGGSREDQATAREWISLFMHEAVLAPGSCQKTIARRMSKPAAQIETERPRRFIESPRMGNSPAGLVGNLPRCDIGRPA